MYGTDSAQCVTERIVRVSLESTRIRTASRHAKDRVRSLAALCLLAFLTSCVMPLAASQGKRGVALRLDAPQPFDPSAYLATLVSGVQPSAMSAPGSTTDFTPTMLVAGSAASPFNLRGTAQDTLRASLCLTAAIYYEAGNEPDEGQRAVAQVILNRVRHPAYPDTICGVVYQGTERNDTLCQFTFGCDGSMARMPVSLVWNRARRNAQAALLGQVFAPVGLATHYHTLAVNPFWNKALTPTAIVGAHIFFRWPGGAGSPKAFHANYSGNEPIPAPKPKIFTSSAPLEITSLPDTAPLSVRLDSRNAGIIPDMSDRLSSVASPKSVMADRRYVSGALPESDVREEYRSSGQWIVR